MSTSSGLDESIGILHCKLKKDKCISATNDNMVDLAKLQWNISRRKLLETLSNGKARIGRSCRERAYDQEGTHRDFLISVLFPDADGGSMVVEEFVRLIITCETIPWYFSPSTLYIIVHFFFHVKKNKWPLSLLPESLPGLPQLWTTPHF